MTYVFPFNAPIKLSTAEFAELSVTSSYAELIATASVAGTVITPVPGDDTQCECPTGYIPCPSLSVPGYDLVCLQLDNSCPGGETRACPPSIPVPTTTTTSTTTTAAPTTTTTAAPTTTTSTTTSTTSTTTSTTTVACLNPGEVCTQDSDCCVGAPGTGICLTGDPRICSDPA